ncbi:uncharacterized protein LOC114932855 [Nylanderia fulva]|uniref:uncharacterized protein LOC114932855 n=1 Tax=Nylanderia fulva TaxID=613905 RepID=UPI0010FB1C71|nr:uncharacterized protein LOC114932855 [Nylanderia fulva]
MTELLNDTTTYKKLQKDPANRMKTKVNELVKGWHDMGIVDEMTYNRLKSTCGNLPRCYGLPKVHKKGYPLRIIVSSVGSPTYNVAQYLREILSISIPKPKSYVKDSWTFVEAIRHTKINDDQFSFSLDVTSLFTNIPKDLALTAVEKRWTYITKNTDLTLPQFLHALSVVLDLTSFEFGGKYYEKIFGCPMGSPLSPILADLVMDELETQCLSKLNCIPVFYRYVDDIFAIAPKTKIDEILTIFNSYHERLMFTHEAEVNGFVNFLDVTIVRAEGTLLTNWYRKPTFSGRRKRNNSLLISTSQINCESLKERDQVQVKRLFPHNFIKKGRSCFT